MERLINRMNPEARTKLPGSQLFGVLTGFPVGSGLGHRLP